MSLGILVATNLTKGGEKPHGFLKEEVVPIKISVSDNRGGAGSYVWPAKMNTLEERPLDQYSETQVEAPKIRQKRHIQRAFFKVKERMELRTLKRLAEKAKTSHNYCLGEKAEYVWIEDLGSNTEFVSVAKGAVSVSRDRNVQRMCINYSFLEVAESIVDFLKENGRDDDIKSVACGVAERRTKGRASVFKANVIAIATATPPDPLAKYAIDALEKNNKQEFIKEVILGNHGSFTTSRYAIEVLLRNGGKADIIDAMSRLCKRLNSYDSPNCAHFFGTIFDLAVEAAMRETTFFLIALSRQKHWMTDEELDAMKPKGLVIVGIQLLPPPRK
jgi:hypothetical protein